jgi:uncharacterized protein YbcV (DUF1398 family)
MDAQRIAMAHRCLNAAHDGTMAFPQIVEVLIRSGFESYIVDYRRGATTYFLPDGDSVMLENLPSRGTVAPHFDQAGIATQVKCAQANPPDYSYIAFCENLKALGCAGYIVSFSGRRALYFGRTAETHVENFPE